MKFVLAYHGGGPMPEDQDEAQAIMAAWQSWMEGHGAAFTDMGNPIAASATVDSSGVSDGGGANPLTGYSLIEASDLAAATAIAEECPILQAGGSVEVAQTVDM